MDSTIFKILRNLFENGKMVGLRRTLREPQYFEFTMK
jgi:hypothetical protein